MEKIWAVEPTYLVGYLETTLNISDEIKQKPEAFFCSLDNDGEKTDILSISDDTAIINIKGLLSQDGPSFVDRFFGFDGTAYGEIIEAIAEIQGNDDVKTVRLVMDTPGGDVAGVDKVFQAISELSKSKAVIAESHGLIASAGYWIASASNKIVATSPADEIGSIGVVVVAVDFSKAREECGIKVVVIRSKNAPNKHPDVSTEKGKNTLQERVDSIERVFIGRISEGRGIATETIERTFARGSVLIAEDPDSSKDDALSVGMIDAVESSVIPTQAPKDGNRKQKAQDSPIPASKNKEEKPMDLKEALADSGLAQEITARDKENIATGVKTEKAEATARTEECKKYLVSDEYPEVVKNLAIDVITGKCGMDALTGAVTVIDAQKEQKKAADAKAEAADQKETPPDAQVVSSDVPEGICETNEQYEAMEKKAAAGNC